MRVLFVLLTFLSLKSAMALEIDEKLTLRFLKISNSKKTVLINRGAEDGLAVGDHAKFFVTSGVIARGVVEKVSPSRSVWSLYRIVDPAEIIDGKVLNLKIASPVKITEDPSKSVAEESSAAGSEKMGMNDGAAETGATSSPNEAEEKEFEEMGIEEKAVPAKKEMKTKGNKAKESKVESTMEEPPVRSGLVTSKNWEIWGMLYVNALTGTVEDPTSTTSETAASSLDLSAGVEKYFLNSDGFLKNTSLTVFLHKRTLQPGGSNKLAIDWMEFGGGGNYHFYNSAASTNRPIVFGGVNFGVGSATSSTTTPATDTVPAVVNSVSITNTFFSFGVGVKYVLNNGFGLRSLLDYYRTSETYKNTNDDTVKRTLAGPRVQFGISYRF